MYDSYFGLTESPFSITPDPRYLYMSDGHREALAHLLYGIGEGGGFVQLTGEVGTGKTTLCRYLLEQLPPDVDVALILNPEAHRARAAGLGLRRAAHRLSDRNHQPARSSSTRSTGTCSMRTRAARRTVLVIDEAQNLTAEVLEQIRLLTNLETTREKLLQIILIGQPELSQLLERAQTCGSWPSA